MAQSKTGRLAGMVAVLCSSSTAHSYSVADRIYYWSTTPVAGVGLLGICMSYTGSRVKARIKRPHLNLLSTFEVHLDNASIAR